LDWFRLWKPCLPKKGDLQDLEVKMVDLSPDKLAEIIADSGSEDEFEGFTLDDLEPNICNKEVAIHMIQLLLKSLYVEL